MGDLINEILAVLRQITEFKKVTIWNNQYEYIENGENYSYPMPCLFVELQNDSCQQLGSGYQGSDLIINLHIAQNVFNGTNIDENLTIFALRDLVIKKLANFKPATAGQFVKINEMQDFDHTNVYHYQIGYTTHWIDNTAVEEEFYTTPETTPIDPIVTEVIIVNQL